MVNYSLVEQILLTTDNQEMAAVLTQLSLSRFMRIS